MVRVSGSGAGVRAAILATMSAALVFWGGQTGASAQAQHVHDQPDAPKESMSSWPPRDASGTAWLPDETPMYAVHGRRGSWDLMGHGSLFLQFLEDGGERGHEQFGAVNWLMGMAGRAAGPGRFVVRAMFSFEPWTIGGCGYPDLLASGETCSGQPIVDQQHPHDFVMELAAIYQRPVSRSVSMQLYAGPAGEPALGPVAFPHRLSAMANPLAPISHHWLDATHITYGVVTAGLFGRRWKAESSLFNGREPDDDRTDLDLADLDSFSGRVWWLPSDRVALQVSAGRLRDAEEEGSDVDRITASATYHRPLGDRAGTWATTVAWGRNREHSDSSNFLLAETSLTRRERDTWFGRIDAGRKPAHDLGAEGAGNLAVSKVQAGYVRSLGTWLALTPGIGGSVSLSIVPSSLASEYGSRTVFGFGAFLTLRPAAMAANAVDPHAGHQMP